MSIFTHMSAAARLITKIHLERLATVSLALAGDFQEIHCPAGRTRLGITIQAPSILRRHLQPRQHRATAILPTRSRASPQSPFLLLNSFFAEAPRPNMS